ncbi:hypothetical protein OIU77_006211 [Salix suchowensis]|uniref:Uncharacterized protein n=1 Tax=Salix suchowensis TaxID=1278906 RepID=A0ABQ9ALH8_9ROSI|nr:hypothetical protein OIU77_006211 [Salix suchowensis]
MDMHSSVGKCQAYIFWNNLVLIQASLSFCKLQLLPVPSSLRREEKQKK